MVDLYDRIGMKLFLFLLYKKSTRKAGVFLFSGVRITMRLLRNHPYLTIFISFGFLFLLGNSLFAVTDSTESNYVLTAKEMVESGDFLSPRIFGNYWYDKPILYYWELIASFLLFGVNEGAARLPGGLFALASLGYLYWFARRVYDEKIAAAAVIILGTSFEFWFLSKSIITDLSLFFFLSVTMGSFYLGYRENRRYYFLCYLASALAVLTKGPIGLLLPGLSVFLFLLMKKDMKEIAHVHLFSGFLLFFLVSAPWYVYMYHTHGYDFLLNFFGVHNFLRATVSEHDNASQWWYYLVIYLAGMAPWSFLSLPALWKNRNRLSLRGADDLTRYLLLWAGTVIVVFSLMATKYTTYTFPSLFAISLLLAKLLHSEGKLLWRGALSTAAVYVALTFTVLPVATYLTSGKSVGTYISHMDVRNRPVIYERKYRTSTAIYSHVPIGSLWTEKEIEENKRGSLSWDAKNVMPLYAKERLGDLKDGYILLRPPKRNDVQGETEIIDVSYVNGKEVRKVHTITVDWKTVFE